ncbi:VanZ family protein [Nocardiopsis sp. NPDC050513]|uniref:VanZ family protein n=1 Tax=Nocardiopsis sp. NPDC050513 TaxID=3364338 RepID=UPI00378FAAB5
MRKVHGPSVWHAVLHIDAGAAPLLLGTFAIPALPLAWLGLVRPRAAGTLGALGIAAVLFAYAVLVVDPGGGWPAAGHAHDVPLPADDLAAGVGVIDPAPAEPPTPLLDGLLAQAVLFVPLGLVTFPVLTSPRARAAVGPIVSATVEGLQFTLVSGRGADLADLCANTVGHLVGLGMMGCATALLGCRVGHSGHESVPDGDAAAVRDR